MCIHEAEDGLTVFLIVIDVTNQINDQCTISGI